MVTYEFSQVADVEGQEVVIKPPPGLPLDAFFVLFCPVIILFRVLSVLRGLF